MYRGVHYDLGTDRWRSGAIEPRGYLFIERFFLDATTPVWWYALADALIEKRLTLRPGRNEAVVRYAVLRAAGPVTFEVRVLADWRDHGAATPQPGALPATSVRDDGIAVRFGEASADVVFRSDRGDVVPAASWYRDYDLARERERDLGATDAHAHVATFSFTLAAGETANLGASVGDFDHSLSSTWDERAAHDASVLDAAKPASSNAAQLALAADQFVVTRATGGDANGRSVIAGYPWFTDWGRDTAIALPGLLLATGRLPLARTVLETFAQYIDGGMLPNVFPDRGETPEYNTVDAALWYVEAVRAYVAVAGLDDAFPALYAACVEIVAGYRRGTRFGIRMDPADALVTAGVPGVQLTWMDAISDGTVVTPRIGKPVEINALWYNALCVLADLTRRGGRVDTDYAPLARRVRAGFARYVLPGGAGLADVIDGPEGDDRSLRPNQLFAAALEYSPLSRAGARDVVNACAPLVTSHGVRTLAPSDPHYVGRYAGSPAERDRAYHQGTVWPWLLGPYARAYAKAYDEPATARTYLEPLLRALADYGLGTIGEIADGDAPFAWKGAFAQAWSVGQLLFSLRELE